MNMFEEKKINTSPLENLGEFGLIEHLTKGFEIKQKTSITGVGDDAAVLSFGNQHQLLSTDLLVEGVHFDLSYTPLKHLGYKAVTTNVSDICAMNGKATQIVVGIAVSNRYSVEALEELYVGIKLACENYKLDLVGGDTTSSTSGLMISVSVIGQVDKEKISYRSGAKVNDLLVCTGDLGAAYLGLQLLNRENKIFRDNPSFQPDLSGHDYILQRQLRPEAGNRYIDILSELKITPTAMIDISDGLSSETLHISKKSDVGITIYEEKIPIDYSVISTAEEFNINPIVCALNGGEDYELLFTVCQSDYEKLKKDPDFTIIGFVNNASEGNNFIAKDGSSHKLSAQGWNSVSLKR